MTPQLSEPSPSASLLRGAHVRSSGSDKSETEEETKASEKAAAVIPLKSEVSGLRTGAGRRSATMLRDLCLPSDLGLTLLVLHTSSSMSVS